MSFFLLHILEHGLEKHFSIALLQGEPFPVSLKIGPQIIVIPFEYTRFKVYFTLFLQVVIPIPGHIVICPVNLVLEILTKVVDMLTLVELVALCGDS